MNPTIRSSKNPSEPYPDSQLDSIRAILLSRDWERLSNIEEALISLRETALGLSDEQKIELENLRVELVQLQRAAHEIEDKAGKFSRRLDQIRADIAADSQALEPRLISRMSSIIQQTIHNSKDEMAEALGPVMGEAIRVQIRDSKDEMVEALYPIILATVQRAIAEFAREFQRNIDARLKSTFGPRGLLRSGWARLRGVSPSDLAFRDALPFSIEELFLIQHDSGLLLAHHHADGAGSDDSDLLSGMLTAIRDFANDSFGDGRANQELDEIQYGEERIVIQSGQYVYLAAVTTGIEPEWFRARLRRFISELHIQHAPRLRDYSGNPADLPDLQAELRQISSDILTPKVDQRSQRRRRPWLYFFGGAALILMAALACFYIQFTLALLPVAFGNTATPTLTPPATASLTWTPTPLPTNTVTPSRPNIHLATSTHQPTSTNTAVPTSTPNPTFTLPATATPTPVPTATATFPPPRTNSPVWARSFPGLNNPPTIALAANTQLTLLAVNGEWAQISWVNGLGPQSGWIPLKYISLNGPIPNDIITPAPGG